MTQDARPVFLLAGLLTFAAALVAQFATQGVALFLRAQESSSGFIGLIYIASVPYTLRFLWAPLVDRTSLRGTGRYARWLILTQALVCVAMISLFFVTPVTAPAGLLFVIAAYMIALGTQQTALGGMITANLDAENYAKGASIQGASSAAGGVVLGAAVLYVLGDIGWHAVITSLLLVALIGLIVCLRLAHQADVQKNPHRAPVSLLSHLSIFREKPARQVFAISVLVNMSVVIPFGAKAILLIDAGYSISLGALYGIVLGNLFGMLGALGVRPIVDRYGGVIVLASLGLLNTGVMGYLTTRALDGLDATETLWLVFFASFSVFASFIASRALAMRLCHSDRQATELASFIGFEAIVFLIIAGVSIALLDHVGLAPILIALLPFSLIGAVYALRRGDSLLN